MKNLAPPNPRRPAIELLIDRVFHQLALTYPAEWERNVRLAPTNEIRSLWAIHLDGYQNRPAAIEWAMANLPERCPNVIEFLHLVRRAPAPDVPRIASKPADKAKAKQILAQLRPAARQAMHESRADPKYWAWAIIERRDAGEVLPYAIQKNAEAALARELATKG